mmetsp:Transcript_57692/g.113580  ORF Transcript_57692/g.113580 Transcript_57692/m.113580 type:complete len:95 (+) Transcript_57692:605-889(+)
MILDMDRFKLIHDYKKRDEQRHNGDYNQFSHLALWGALGASVLVIMKEFRSVACTSVLKAEQALLATTNFDLRAAESSGGVLVREKLGLLSEGC